MSRRVVIVGPVGNPGLDTSLRDRGYNALVAETVRHALLLQRMFQPDAILFPRLPTESEMGLLGPAASRPIVVLGDATPTVAIDFVRQGVARVIAPSSTPNQLEAVLSLPLAREKPVVRAVAQLALMKATGALQVGAAAALGTIVVDAGAILSAVAGERSGRDALAFLGQQDGPLAVSFGEGSDASVDIDGAVPIDLVDDDDDDFELAPVVPHTPATGEVLPPTHVLVVEDDADLLELYRVLLKARGFRVDVAHDGEEGFALAVASRPDVILSDIMMPRASGWDLLGMVRNNARLRETPFAVFSHHGEMLRALKTANGGADAYLEKSLRPEAVISVVQALAQPLRTIEADVKAGAPRFEGSLFGLGPQTLLRLCQRQRLTGRLSVRPQHQRFLIVLQSGDIVDAQCSMAASTLHHRDALRALLLVDDGPFTFERGPVPPGVNTELLPLLDQLNGELETLLDDLRTGALLSGAVLKVRMELLTVYRTTAPTSAMPVLDQIEAGRPPRDLIAAGTVDLVLVDSVVRDLFRKGVVAP